MSTWDELESFVKKLGFDSKYEKMILKVAEDIVCDSDSINL